MASLTQTNVTPGFEAAYDFVRFMRSVQIGSRNGDCWRWTGNRPGDRYGHFSVRKRTVKAHRWIYEKVVGRIGDGLVLRHKCDNPACVNPLHLEPGTLAENTRDKFERGRAPNRQGEKHPLAKVDEAVVQEIRALAACGHNHSDLAERFGIARQHVGKIVRRQNWKHI